MNRVGRPGKCTSTLPLAEVPERLKGFSRFFFLHKRHLSLTVLESGESKVKVLADLVSVEDPLSGLRTANVQFRLYPHMLQRSGRERG